MRLGRKRRSLFIIAATLAVGACGAPSVYNAEHMSAYTHGEVLRAANDRSFRIEAIGGIGSGTRIEADRLEATLAQALERHGPHWFRPNYTTAATGEADPHYRLRWLFNVPAGFPNSSACRDDVGTAAAGWREQTGVVVAAFCREERFLSLARGSFGAAEDIDSPAFARWVGMMGRSVLPLRNPDRDDDRDCRRPRLCG